MKQCLHAKDGLPSGKDGLADELPRIVWRCTVTYRWCDSCSRCFTIPMAGANSKVTAIEGCLVSKASSYPHLVEFEQCEEIPIVDRIAAKSAKTGASERKLKSRPSAPSNMHTLAESHAIHHRQKTESW